MHRNGPDEFNRHNGVVGLLHERELHEPRVPHAGEVAAEQPEVHGRRAAGLQVRYVDSVVHVAGAAQSGQRYVHAGGESESAAGRLRGPVRVGGFV